MRTLVASAEPPERDGHERLLEAFKRLQLKSVREVREMGRWRDEDVPGDGKAPEES